MAKTAKFVNNWQALSAKPEVKGNLRDNGKIVEPYKVRRENAYLSMFPSEEGEKYYFCIIPDSEGRSFIMTEIMTIKRFKFRNPKTNEDYFENLKLPMDPAKLFDMSVVEKAAKRETLTDEDKKILSNIKVHADLVQRYKDLYFCKEEGINFGYAKAPTRYNGRLRKEALTGFFGIPTKWKGTELDSREVKFIQNRYMQFQDKFTELLNQTAETHDELQPTWYEDYFSNINGYKGVIDVNMGLMKVGGKGASVKLIKTGKDPIEDKGAGILNGIDPKKVKLPKEKENALSHLHYYMGFDSTQDLWQDMYVDRFTEAIEDLEAHLGEVRADNALNVATPEGGDISPEASKTVSEKPTNDLPF